jgi:hypothetical protein
VNKQRFNSSFSAPATPLGASLPNICPVWPGQPSIAHWETPFPSDVEGTKSKKEDAVWKVTQQIKRRLELFWSLPFDKLDALRLEKATKEIGQKELVD